MLEDVIYQAMLLDGSIIPTTPAEVEFVERHRDTEKAELPAALRDAEAVLARGNKRAERGEHLDLRPEDLEDQADLLARAAREGGDISKEIEERMKRAREKADREAGDDGEE